MINKGSLNRFKFLTQEEHAYAKFGGKHRSIRGVRGFERGKSCSFKDLAILFRKGLKVMCTESKHGLTDDWRILVNRFSNPWHLWPELLQPRQVRRVKFD
jgi:hypothetical protein